MEWHTFAACYKTIILKAISRLKDNSFACYVVGNYRHGKSGYYRDLVGLTIRGFAGCGLELYNEAILVTAIGSLPLRTEKAFESSRKLGRTHQNVLIFCKGNPKEATSKLGLTITRKYDMVSGVDVDMGVINDRREQPL